MSCKRTRFPLDSINFDRLAQTWIQDCSENHINCGPAMDYPLPTRVIYVGHDNQDPYLVVTNGTTAGKWISLSYCWGTVETLKTTAETLEEHKKRIPLDKLPRTIRDAVIITRSLGIAYLWVDALCIIQGSKQDWISESLKMSDVYRNSVATIAASSASDVQGSCFLDRSRLANLPCSISFQSHRGVKTRRWIHGARGLSLGDKIRCSPLQQRGWTLQEAHLSIRILHYTDSELLWQCREGVRRELAPCDLVTADDPLVTRRMFDSFSALPRNVFTRWYHLVQEFTGRRLTFETDKLPAISGMAAEMGRFLGARQRRRRATDEEHKKTRAHTVPDADWGSADPSAWFMLHNKELTYGRPTPGLEDQPLSSVSLRLLSRYMGSDIDPFPGKATKHFATCDECSERICGMRYKCQVCPDFDYCDSCIDKADALHPLHTFTSLDRVKPAEPEDGGTLELAANRPMRHETDMPSIGGDGGDDDSDGDHGGNGNGKDDGHTAALYVYAEEDRFPPILEWPVVVTESNYLAGIWEADFHQGLTWRVKHSARREPGRDAADYRAPSWSWASVDGQVCYEPNLTDYLRPERPVGIWAEVVNCEVSRIGDGQYGGVSGGELTLLTPIAEMPFYYEDRKPVRKQHIKGRIVAENLLCLDHEPPRLPATAKCARINWCSCLVLEPTSNVVGDTTYRRIGIWSHDNITATKFDDMTAWQWETKMITII